jgi:hypothetical protein
MLFAVGDHRRHVRTMSSRNAMHDRSLRNVDKPQGCRTSGGEWWTTYIVVRYVKGALVDTPCVLLEDCRMRICALAVATTLTVGAALSGCLKRDPSLIGPASSTGTQDACRSDEQAPQFTTYTVAQSEGYAYYPSSHSPVPFGSTAVMVGISCLTSRRQARVENGCSCGFQAALAQHLIDRLAGRFKTAPTNGSASLENDLLREAIDLCRTRTSNRRTSPLSAIDRLGVLGPDNAHDARLAIAFVSIWDREEKRSCASREIPSNCRQSYGAYICDTKRIEVCQPVAVDTTDGVLIVRASPSDASEVFQASDEQALLDLIDPPRARKPVGRVRLFDLAMPTSRANADWTRAKEVAIGHGHWSDVADEFRTLQKRYGTPWARPWQQLDVQSTVIQLALTYNIFVASSLAGDAIVANQAAKDLQTEQQRLLVRPGFTDLRAHGCKSVLVGIDDEINAGLCDLQNMQDAREAGKAGAFQDKNFCGDSLRSGKQ